MIYSLSVYLSMVYGLWRYCANGVGMPMAEMFRFTTHCQWTAGAWWRRVETQVRDRLQDEDAPRN